MIRCQGRLAFSCFVLLGLVLVVWAYLPSFQGAFIYDDYDNIINAPAAWVHHLTWEELSASARAFAGNRPWARLSFGLNYYFGQDNPWGYHLVNLVIHLLSLVLLFFVCQELLGLVSGGPGPGLALEGGDHPRTSLDSRSFLAFAAALVWAVHPHNVQAVTYIVQRMASLAGLFMLVTVYAYLRARQARGRARLSWAGAGLAALLLAMLSKENSAITPLLCLAVEVFVFQQGSLSFLANRKVVFGLVLGVLLVIGLTLVANIPGKIKALFLCYLENRVVEGPSKGFTPWQRLLTEPRILFLYLAHFFWPRISWLCLDHYPPLSTSLFFPLSTVLSLLGIFVLLLLAWRIRKRFPLLALAIYWYFLGQLIEALAPALDLMYDHRMYVPSMLLPLGFLDVGWRLFKANPRAFSLGTLLPVLFVGTLICFLGIQTWRYNQVWESGVRVWEHNVQAYPEDIRPNYNLADALLASGQYVRAKEQLEICCRLDHDFAPTYYDLAKLAVQDEDFAQAEGYLKHFFALCQQQTEVPKYVYKAMALMSFVQAAQGHEQEAMQWADKVDYTQWPDPYLFDFLAKAMLRVGRFDLAARYFSLGARYHPEKKDFFREAGAAFALQGNKLVREKDYDQAWECFQQAVKLCPQEAVFYEGLMGIAWARGEHEQAISLGQQALKLDPEDNATRRKFVRFCRLYGDRLRRQGKVKDAVHYYRLGLKVDPKRPKMLNNLAWWLATARDRELQDLDRALELARQAAELSGFKDPYVLDTLAEIYLRSGDLDKSRAITEQALSLAREKGLKDVVLAEEKRLEKLHRP